MQLTQPQKIILASGIVILLIIGGYFLSKSMSNDEIVLNSISEAPNSEDKPAAAPHRGQVVVYIAGAVRNEGVIRLDAASRVYEALEAAGGLQEKADLSKINLAEKVKDGQKIEIPYITVEQNVHSESGGVANQDGKINVNVATASELLKVKGIGEKMAADIMAYRKEHGKFSSLTDLQKVKGIGAGKLSKIKEYIIAQ
ncbi:MAG: helix-hairpin-helix domain-containing protein [Candidatus Margulisbacteria bacterium]|nr:helix-hairpin-helix domain-containing protein [Candidatus Margulisiibacteriota bacterium]MBU1021375.1 helix-hairpin-helix domain-containing protein [Candidatus Margulisiibacteriota bacterium]MBU1729136.1 helix-hairpin-helix domain-containing protein [Candidatus Margulisiibacteriota bacterium]MBU1954809.1 helix-hairpin-helix domain-containing protein [Candidatus Margulisiibacteriota bacterium]